MNAILKAAIIMGFLNWLTGCSRQEPTDDIGRVDLYLKKWDEFATGSPDSGYHLGGRFPEFEASLLRMFAVNDARAPSRFVFYQLVQVGGFIEAESPLGRAFARATNGTCRTTLADGDIPKYFAGDLYFWWIDHASEFASMPLMDNWLKREFAQKTAIPMYTAVRKSEASQ
ncbi:MAG: hypothetical protein H7A55_12120 [Verrucomicrobiaceae bacterium]|nr:hypothetical protein [Verrucomicrobiaceae bacterium]